jgi:hypothetical protein
VSGCRLQDCLGKGFADFIRGRGGGCPGGAFGGCGEEEGGGEEGGGGEGRDGARLEVVK